MTAFTDQQHPRARDGKFSVKEQTEATGVTLACDPADVTEAPETFEMLWCEPCGEAFDESEAASLYECSNCGTKGAERRCDQCNKFMARSEEPGCPSCEEPVDEAPVAVVHDHDGKVIRAEDYDPDGASKSERDAIAAVERKAQEEAARAARAAEKKANSAAVTAADIAPGTVLINPDDDRSYATEAEVLSARHVETPDGPITIFKTYDYGSRVVVRRSSDPVATRAVVSDHPTERGHKRRLTAADFEGARLLEGFNPDMGSVSSPSNGIDVQVGSLSREGGTLPAIALCIGRRRDGGDISGMVAHIGRWDDPTTAADALDEMDRAADALAAARAEHPPTPEVAADEAVDAADRPEGWRAAQSRAVDWISADVVRTVEMEVGISSWEVDKGAVLAMRSTGGGLNSAITDPAVLKSAVAEARKHLHTLTGIPTRPDVVDDKI